MTMLSGKDPEKPEVIRRGTDSPGYGTSYEGSADHYTNLSPEERAADRKLVRRLDFRLIPWLCTLYLLAFLDRTNIGNAKVADLGTDLGLTTQSYNETLTIFFVSYALFEPLTNVLLKKMRPSVFIPIIMISWGASMLGSGFVHDWSGLMAARWFLGLAEAGLFPGINYYLSCWYTRSELGIRLAVFFSAAALSGSFGGLLAAAIGKMGGLGGRPGWAWIFILEGLLTMVFGAASYWVVQDFPEDAKFLNEADRVRVKRRLMSDQQASAEHESFRMDAFWSAVKDWKTWLACVIYMGCDMPLYAFSLFLPTIIKNLGLRSSTTVETQLLSVPPYALATVVTVLAGWMADRTKQRGLCNIFLSPIAIGGFVMLIASDDPAVQYAGTFLGALGIYPCVANTITWVANNVEGVYKRGIVLGFVIGWGNLNGIASSNIFFSSPRFFEGHGVVLAYLTLFLFGGSVAMTMLLRRENRLRREGARDHAVMRMSPAELDAMGDMRPNFLYTL